MIKTIETKQKILEWQRRGLMYTATGYGRKIPTRWMVRLDKRGPWRRVYCCCYSNVGVVYIAGKLEDNKKIQRAIEDALNMDGNLFEITPSTGYPGTYDVNPV